MAIITSDDVKQQLGLDTPSSTQNAIIASSIKWAEGSVRRYLRYDPEQKQRTEYYPTADLTSNQRNSIWEASESVAYLRYEVGGQNNELLLRHLPVRSIDALYIDFDGRFGTKSGAFNSETLKTPGTDYWARFDGVDDNGSSICRDGILISHGLWPDEPGSVKVVYTAGYSEDELGGSGILVDASPIYQAIVFEATRKAKQTILLASGAGSSVGGSLGFTAGQISSERLGDYSYTLSSTSSASSSSGGAAGLYDGTKDIAYETMDMLADFVNIGLSLTG